METNVLAATKNEDVQIHMDYLAFTIPLEDERDVCNAFENIKEDLANLFFMTSFHYGELSDWAQDGYEYQLSLGEYLTVRFGGKRNAMRKIINWDNNSKTDEKYDSLMVECKGQGCREIESLSGGTIDYLKIIEWVETHGGRFTRIDIAIDDMKGDVIRLSKILDLVSKGLYTSSFRSKPNVNGSALKKNNIQDIDVDSEPCTLYFGSIDSSKRLCIYNKKAERKMNNDSWNGEYWIRYEMRFRHEAADNLAYFMMATKMKDIGSFACEQLKTLLTLKCQCYKGRKSSCKNVRMLDILPAWNKFLNAVKGTSFSLRPIMESTIEDKKMWREKSLSRQTIILEIADVYEDSDWIMSGMGRLYEEKQNMLAYLRDNKNKITIKDLSMINNYRREHHTSGMFVDLTMEDIDAFIDNLENEVKEFEKRFRLPF